MLLFQEFIERSDKATSVDELVKVFLADVKKLGYDRMAFCLLSDHSHIGLTAGVDFLNNYPEDWLKYYAEKRFDQIDPVISYCRQKVGTFTWDEMAQTLSMTATQKKCLELGTEAKLYNGVFSPLWGPHRFAGIALATTEKKDACASDTTTLDLLHAYGNHFYLAFQRLHRKVRLDYDDLDNVFFTQKEYAILTWVARGKTNSDIGDILFLSPETINYHIKKIFKKLRANDRVVACAKAISLGLINP
jgi:DNA-binding CsgD family transcriptional regulator